MRAPVRALFADAAAANAAAVEMRMSLYERHNEALFVREELLSAREDGGGGEKVPRTAVVARGEIGHAHGDLSVHVYVAPADARVLIEKGWAERHRLAVPRGAWWGAERYRVGDTFLIVYGPRDEGELEVLRTILVNAMRFMTGREDVRVPEWRGG
ncbi:hypothetical protein B0J12DRAFT_643247 [Macrophomina phaseolina]|uniref:Luciferase domain-containing protein n=1 Tax=Macrophomina phaseolina TaxID=35725 RepID=A0ABQ8GW01_9PEZI|nr:hypothetical protein B0J12DRAFT_643247 [Macrophomina phaseolina]